MANDYEDDDLYIRNIIRNTENGHFLNTNGDYYLGTRKLTFPRNYDIPEYPINVDRLKFNRELNDLYYNYDSISQKYRTFWGDQHEPEMYKSFPMRLNLLSGHEGRHPLRWNSGQYFVSEYLNPLRNPMDGDLGEALDRFRKATVQDIQNICVFCMSHPQPEDCIKYWTPMERHERLQNINYTLFLQGRFQICISCLQREHEHRGFEECMQARDCSYCLLPGHHKALCTSAVHHQTLAKNRADNDARERLQRNLRNPEWCRANPWLTLRDTENGVGNDIYLMMMMKADKKRTALVSEEVNRRVAEIYENTMDEREWLLDQRRQEHAEAVIRADSAAAEEASAENVEDGVQCLDKSWLDYHESEYFVATEGITQALQYLENFTFGNNRTKIDVRNAVKIVFDRVYELFRCTNNCDAETANYFCRCGCLRLCYSCMVVIDQRGKRTSPHRHCKLCNRKIPEPRKRGANEVSSFVTAVDNLKRTMVNAMNAIIDWAGSTDSTDKFPDATRSFLDTLNKLMECNLCSFEMNHVSRGVMKAACKCNDLHCRSCAITLKVDECYSRSRKSRCTESILDVGTKCTKCRQIVPYFTPVIAFTLLGQVVSYLLKKPINVDERTLRNLFDAKQRREEDDYNERMNEVYAAAGRILHEDDQEGGAPVDDEEDLVHVEDDDEEDLVHVEDAAMDDIFYDGNEEALRMSLATYQQEQQRMRENYMEATQMQREDEQDQAINAAILQNEHAALMDQGAAEKAARLEQENEQQLTERADAEKELVHTTGYPVGVVRVPNTASSRLIHLYQPNPRDLLVACDSILSSEPKGGMKEDDVGNQMAQNFVDRSTSGKTVPSTSNDNVDRQDSEKKGGENAVDRSKKSATSDVTSAPISKDE